MTAIMRAISRTALAVTAADIAKHALLFCAACAFVFVLSLTHGLDLSPGFF